MSWLLLLGLCLALGTAVLVLWHRRAELAAMEREVAERQAARQRGSHKARLQYPWIDLSRCIGCGTCVRACPEEGVLGLVHGQAMVLHGARCVGHGLCARECPVGAIAVTLEDIETRRDIPAVRENFESTSREGLFLAGELTGHALIKTAISHGVAVATEVSRRVRSEAALSSAVPGGGATPPAPLPGGAVARGGVATLAPPEPPRLASEEVLDLCIVGAGPAGLACALEARRRGLSFVVLEQESLGGTVSKYPRRKLVMTQPVELPLYGKLTRTSYTKEELMDLWQEIVREHEIPVREGVEFTGLATLEEGGFRVQVRGGEVLARNVCLALGRRGTPRKLGAPGEELAKVAYSLVDAQSFQGRRILVVGGGDSAIEAALGLAEQPGNVVTLSYRRHAFFRIKPRNETRLHEALSAGKLEVLFESRVEKIEPDRVVLIAKRGDREERLTLANDEVFVMAGGVPPFQLLETVGVSFDPAARPKPAALSEQGTGLLKGLAAAFALSALVLVWAVVFADYYGASLPERVGLPHHGLLRPSGPVGLALGVGATAMILANLSYLARRSPAIPFTLGSLQKWMTAHVATGIGALLLALLHGAMAPRDTLGGHALWGLLFLVITGAIGRYFYSFVPRAANGRELALEDLQARLAALSSEWDSCRGDFAERVRLRIGEIVASGRWEGSFLRRLASLLSSQRKLRRVLTTLRLDARAEGLAESQVAELAEVARRAHRCALMAAHYEELRALLASWRYFHRWVALLMVLLVAMHVVTGLRYADLAFPGGQP